MSIRGSGIQADDGPIGVQFMLDGIPTNDAEGEANIDDFSLRSIRHAEICRGANSLDDGAYALGGAVNLVPATGYDADRLNISLDGGESGEAAVGLSTGAVKGPLDWYASAEARQGSGYRGHSDQRSGNFFGDLGWKMRPGLEDRLYLSVSSLDRELPGGLSHDEVRDDPRQADPDSAVSQNFGSRSLMARIADRLTFETSASRLDAGAYLGFRNAEERSYFGLESRDGIYDFTDYNFGANVKCVAKRTVLRLPCTFTGGIGSTFETEDGTNYANVGGERGTETGSGIRSSVNAPLYGSAQIDVRKNVAVVAGCQAIFAQRRFVDRSSVSGGDADDADGKEIDLWGVNPKLGLLFGANADMQAFVNFNRSWQPPSFDEMVEVDTEAGGGYEFTPLHPQHAWTAEAGMRGERRAVGWELSGYRAWVRDELLEMNDAHGNNVGTVNVERTVHQGIEAGINLEILNSLFLHVADTSRAHRLTLSQSYTYSDFAFDNDSVYGSNRIAGIPVHLYGAELRLESPGGFHAGVTVRCNLSRYPADQANTLFVDPFAVMGCSIGYHPSKGASIYVEVNNLFDTHYAAGVEPIPDARDVDGPARVYQPGEGRTFFSGIQWNL